jgi:hypothetical protein
VVTGADAGGGPHVRVFDGRTGQLLPGLIGHFYAYQVDRNAGVRVAAGDVNGDGRADVITGMGPGAPEGASRRFFPLRSQTDVRIFSGADGVMLRSFVPFEEKYWGGVHLAVARFDGDARVEIIVSKANGDGHLDRLSELVFMGAMQRPEAAIFRYQPDLHMQRLASFEAYTRFGGSVRVAAIESLFKELDPASDEDDYLGLALVTGAGPGGGPHAKLRSDDLGTLLDEFYAYDAGFLGGVWVAG